MWLATYGDGDGSLDKVDPSTGEVVDSIPLPDAPSYLAAGNGQIGPDHRAERRPGVAPDRRGDRRDPPSIPGLRGPVVLAADSTVWAIGSGLTDAAEIDQLDPTSRSIINRVPLIEPPVDMVEAAGSLWALMPPTDGTERDDLVRIDPTSGDVTATLDVGSDGIWLAGNFQGVYLSSNGTEGRELCSRLGGRQHRQFVRQRLQLPPLRRCGRARVVHRRTSRWAHPGDLWSESADAASGRVLERWPGTGPRGWA